MRGRARTSLGDGSHKVPHDFQRASSSAQLNVVRHLCCWSKVPSQQWSGLTVHHTSGQKATTVSIIGANPETKQRQVRLAQVHSHLRSNNRVKNKVI